MTSSPEEIRAKLEAGRAVIASGLHALADEIEALPLEDAAEALSWLGDQIGGRALVSRTRRVRPEGVEPPTLRFEAGSGGLKAR